MAEMAAPTPTDTICDPASGVLLALDPSAGFPRALPSEAIVYELLVAIHR
jgi:hypothetical protein